MAKRNRRRKPSATSTSALNRPCPCGSGRRFKDCHGATATSFRVEPENRPEVVDYHLSSPDGVNWTRQPGSIFVMVGGRRPEDTDAAIEALISKFATRAEAAGNSQLKDRLLDLKHKLYAVTYHLRSLTTEIERRASEFEKSYRAGSGAYLELENPRLVYETEAFLFQVKSALDVLTQVMGLVVPPLDSMRTFKKANVEGTEHHGGAVIRALRLHGFTSLSELLEAARTEWIQELVAMRDTIMHYTALREFHSFIEEPYKGGDTVTIHYPSMPSGTRVDTYCASTQASLLRLVRDTLLLCPPPLGDSGNADVA